MSRRGSIQPGAASARMLTLIGAGGADCRTLAATDPTWTPQRISETICRLRRNGHLTGGEAGRPAPYALTEAGAHALVPHLLEELASLRVPASDRPGIQRLIAAVEVGNDLAAIETACQQLVPAHLHPHFRGS